MKASQPERGLSLNLSLVSAVVPLGEPIVLHYTGPTIPAPLYRALLAMPEPYSLASWQPLVNNPGSRDKEALMRELAHVMSPVAADLLTQMWNPSHGPLLMTALATVLLDNMYRAGNESLQRHLEATLARYGKKCANTS